MEPIKQKGFHKLPEPVKGAVITVSDRCYAGTREDASGPLAAKLLADYDVIVDGVKLIPDGIEEVTQALREAIAAGARVILTTGGTGVTPRDLTPEGTAPLLAVRLDGLAEQVRAYGLAKTPLVCLAAWWGLLPVRPTASLLLTLLARVAGLKTLWKLLAH